MTAPFRPTLVVVVDTNIVSYIYRDDPIAAPYLNEMAGRRAVISFQTYEEILYGALSSNWGDRRISDLLAYVAANYEMIGYDLELVRTCARLRADSRRRGRELKPADAWIAATAILLNCPLLSHDRDFGNPPDLRVIRHPHTAPPPG